MIFVFEQYALHETKHKTKQTIIYRKKKINLA